MEVGRTHRGRCGPGCASADNNGPVIRPGRCVIFSCRTQVAGEHLTAWSAKRAGDSLPGWPSASGGFTVGVPVSLDQRDHPNTELT